MRKRLTHLSAVLLGMLSFSSRAEFCLPDLLAHLNSPDTQSLTLTQAGVYTRGANAIVAHRNGVDEIAGTADDRLFNSLEDIDAVAYVGAQTLAQLQGLFAYSFAQENIQVVFSPQPADSTHLARSIEIIDNAHTSIDVAIYSFSDASMVSALARARERGVKIRLISNNAASDRKSPSGTRSETLEMAGIDVRYVNKVMHHKFTLVDYGTEDAVLISGSANWSYSGARKYDENTLFIRREPQTFDAFNEEFALLWHHSRDFVCESCGIVSEVDPRYQKSQRDYQQVAFTSDNFYTRTTRYGETFTYIKGKEVVAQRLVDAIAGAGDSIDIASGHLRSWPVAKALLDKQAEGGVSIRVYLDGQEFISETTHNIQQQEVEACLQASDDEEDKEDCYRSGNYFSYALHLAGIEVKFKAYSYRWHYSYAPQMHHKYLLIDNTTLTTGSYNLSDNAETNSMENMLFYTSQDYPALVSSFSRNFTQLWNTAEPEVYQSLMQEINAPQASEVPIVFPAMALDWDDLNALKQAIRDVCPAINSDEYRRYPERHYTCDK